MDKASAPSFISPILTERRSDQYDVFLSFRGSDTRKGFTDHLYHSLVKAGTIPTFIFRDENSIPIGEEFGSQILHAITRSKISIPIISENYATSKWCLRELICIMDCKKSMSQIVLPIFYKVKPSDIRHLTGNFGNAFHLHKKHFDEKDIQEGQRALTEMSNLSIWESEKIADGHEGELVEKIVKIVLCKLRHDFQLDVTEHLVGIDDHVDKIRNWVNASASDARMIGIYGMGGVGKTTLAKVIYNMLSNDYVHRSYLPDIRETAHNKGITYLQDQLIKEIQPIEHQIWKYDDGINLIKSRFKGKKVLILLDNIDHQDQLNALARKRNWFTSGSIIIVTTRYKAILDQSEFEVDYKYELKEMHEVHSLLLFNKHAFHMDHSLRDFEGISRDIISTTGGLPLALQVIGSYLYRKTDLKVWKDMLKQLKNQPHRDVQKILKTSYDALEDGHKQIFLDIACFFVGEKSKFPMYMWEDCEFYASQGIEELTLRCLVKIGDDGVLTMHDQLRDLGRNIVQQEGPPEKRSRLWLSKEGFEVSMGKKGTDRIQAICLDYLYAPPRFTEGELLPINTYTNEQFKNLQSLRFLQLGWAALSGDFKNLLSELRWLQWDIEPYQCLCATNLHLPNLVVLRLSLIEITDYWRGWNLIKASRLKVLELKNCNYYLECTPDLSPFPELEILVMTECYGLKQVHPSIGKVKSLVILVLSCCNILKELPEEVGKLEELKELIVDHADITKIPMSIGSLRKLEKLSASYCLSLIEIPNSIGNLSSLQHLDLSWSNSLREIPSSIGNLQNLQHLDISHSAIEKLPSTIGRLKKLRMLILEFCQNLKEEIPSEIGDLASLEISNTTCSPISDLSEGIRNLSSLQHFNLSGCRELRSLPELPSSLTYLEVSCQSSVLPQLSSLIHLEELLLYECDLLEYIPELPSRPLKLRVESCDKLILLKLDGLKYLEEFSIERCRSVERMELSQLIRLKRLQATDCHSLVEIQGHDNLELLEEIVIFCCVSIERLILPESHCLKQLKATYCDNLVEIRGLDRAAFLEKLDITKCISMETLPDFSRCEKLQSLKVKDCNKLTQLRGLEKSELTFLDISGCHLLAKIPELRGTCVFGLGKRAL